MARQATAKQSRLARSFAQALTLHRAGELDEADRIYGAILAADPRHGDALHLSGILKNQQGQPAEALRLVAAALRAKPNAADVLLSHGVILDALKRHEEALASFDRVLAQRAGDALLHYNRGNALQSLGRIAEAFHSFDRAIEFSPDLGVAHHNRACALAALERCEEALVSFDRALALDLGPADRVSALSNRGKTLVKLRRLEEALSNYDQALALAPDHVDSLVRRGTALIRLGQCDQALVAFAAALRINPDCLDAYVNRGNAYAVLNQFDAALAEFAFVTARQPDHADANFNEALVRLCLGDFDHGWRKYEYRWHCSQFAALRPNMARPLWLGDADPRGKTILLHAEQGMGDVIQFVRYAPLLAARGVKVIVGVHRPLAALIADVPGVAQVVAEGQPLPNFDLYCPMMSLPLAFATDLATIPASVPYIRAQQARIDRWRERLPQPGRLRIGICWAGTRGHPNDRNRSIPLDRLAKMLSIPGVDFVSLQKEGGELDRAILREHQVLQLGHEFEDFADTAAVIAMLDLVISVDTSVAHLAGAMAKAVALLVPFSPDFRWMLDRTDSPWYPTMRLYRQSAIGDWEGPVNRLCAELEAVAARRRSA
ncbi:MAG TPA: tetratricopeptide repeat protein [Bradyrhizobium sp.]